MPIEYQFVKVETGEAATLDSVDRLLCAETNVTPSADKFCDLYRALMVCGLTVTRDGEITEEAVNAYIDDLTAQHGAEACTPQEKELALRFLCREYKFKSWRSR